MHIKYWFIFFVINMTDNGQRLGYIYEPLVSFHFGQESGDRVSNGSYRYPILPSWTVFTTT